MFGEPGVPTALRSLGYELMSPQSAISSLIYRSTATVSVNDSLSLHSFSLFSRSSTSWFLFICLGLLGIVARAFLWESVRIVRSVKKVRQVEKRTSPKMMKISSKRKELEKRSGKIALH